MEPIAGIRKRGSGAMLRLSPAYKHPSASPTNGPANQCSNASKKSSTGNAFALRRIRYFLENAISEDKNNYYGRVHCNDEPKQNTSLSTQPLYFFSGLSEFL